MSIGFLKNANSTHIGHKLLFKALWFRKEATNLKYERCVGSTILIRVAPQLSEIAVLNCP